jgi:hypothetical protein
MMLINQLVTYSNSSNDSEYYIGPLKWLNSLTLDIVNHVN